MKIKPGHVGFKRRAMLITRETFVWLITFTCYTCKFKRKKSRVLFSTEKQKNTTYFCCPYRFGVVWLARINETIFRAKCIITRNDMQQKLTSLLDMCLLFHLYLNPISTFLLSCIATRLTHVG